MEKIIVVLLDSESLMNYSNIHITYDDTEKAINNDNDIVVTTLINFLSFSYLDKGYKLFAVRKNKIKEFTPGMVAPNCKEIRKEHNLEKIFIGGGFDDMWEDINEST